MRDRDPIVAGILIVEDVDEMRELLGHLVSGMTQFRVSGLSRNCAEVRHELLRRRPDLVLLDEILPGESSLDLLEELGRLKIPVILATSLVGREAEEVPEGALGRILKPGWKTLDQERTRIENYLIQVLSLKTHA